MGKRDKLLKIFQDVRQKHHSSLQTSSEERKHGSSPEASQTSSNVASTKPLSHSHSQDWLDIPPDDLSDIQPDDLWKTALEQVSVEDKELVQAYNEILNQATGVQGNDTQAIAQEVVRLKRTQVLNRQWRLHWRNTTIEVRKVFDSIAKLVIMFKDVGSAATSADPVHAALPWAGILLLLIPIANHHEQYKHILEGLERITELVALYQCIVQFLLNGKGILPSKISYRNHFRPSYPTGSPDEKYVAEIVKLYAKILKYQMKAACDLNRSTLSTFVRNIPKIDDWQGMMQEIDEQDTHCQRYQALRNSYRYGKEELQEAKVYAQKKTKKIEVFVSNLSHLDIERDHENVRYRLSPVYWGSGQWFFRSKEFTEWEQKSDSVLWLQGPVGVGKSCLTSEVIERILSSVTDAQVAFFYCSEQRSESQASSTDIIISILAQLARDAKGDLAPPLKDWRPEDGSEARSSTVFSRKECNDLLGQILISGGQKIIIIDGLDECKDPAALISYFENIHLSSKNSRFFFSSRFGIRSDHQFRDAILVEHLDNSADIENYIRKELESPRRIEGSVIEDSQRAELRALLLRHSRGMFRWVELWLDLILSPEQKISHPGDIQEKLEQLRNFSKNPSREATASLDELYYDLFKRNTQSGHQSRSLAVKALRWLLCAFKPLSIDNLVQAVALNSEGDTDRAVNAEFISRVCSNLIIITTSGIVRLAHRSVKEYLVHSHNIYVQRELQSDECHESFAEDSIHAQAAETCITFILSLGYPSWKQVPTHIETPLLSDVTLSSFEVYSCLLWPAHCEKAGNPQKIERTENQLTSLLDNGATTASTAFRRWIRLLWQYIKSAEYADCTIEGQMRRRLEDAVSEHPNPFLVACIFGFHEVVQELLTREPNLANLHNKRGKSALYLAAENGHCETVRLLLESGADVKETHDRWDSIAYAAAWGGNLDAFRLVAEKIERLADDNLDAALSGGNERLVLDVLERALDVRVGFSNWSIDHTLSRQNEKKISLSLSRSAVRVIEYDRLKFDIIMPIKFDSVPARQHNRFGTSTLPGSRLGLLLDLERANIRRYEIINCFRRVNRDHEQKIRCLYHSGESFEPNGLEEIEGQIAKDSQEIGDNSQRSKDFIASYWRSQKFPEMPPISEVSVGHQIHLQCPICYTSGLSKEVTFRENWRKHVMNDLRPYLCPFIPKCKESSILFRDVLEWEHHLEQKHSSNARFFQRWDESNLEPVVNFNLDEYLVVNGDALGNDRMDEWRNYSSSTEDFCPFCCVNLFPIYNAGIESRERHVARHMENAALSILQQDDYPITATACSDHTQSDRESIRSWSSGSSSSVGEISDDSEGRWLNLGEIGDDSEGNMGDDSEESTVDNHDSLAFKSVSLYRQCKSFEDLLDSS